MKFQQRKFWLNIKTIVRLSNGTSFEEDGEMAQNASCTHAIFLQRHSL